MRKLLEAIKADISAALDRQGLTTTGRAKASLIVSGNKLEAVGYINTLFRYVGRSSGKFVPIEPLIEWLRAKGLKFRNSSGQFVRDKQAAFMISKTIQKKGSRIFRDNRRGIRIDDIIEKRASEYAESYADELARGYIKEIDKVIISR